MNTNMTGFRCIRMLWVKVASALDGLPIRQISLKILPYHNNIAMGFRPWISCRSDLVIGVFSVPTSVTYECGEGFLTHPLHT